MSIKVLDDDSGKEIEAFTAEEVAVKENAIKAEYEAKLLDKDNHIKTKTDEFLKGKQSVDLKEVEWQNKIEEAKKIAEESRAKVFESEFKRQESLKKIAMEKYVGNDPELTKKFEESWGLINLEIKDDSDINLKAELVAKMSGFSNNPGFSTGGGMSMSGGYAPNFVKQQSEEKEKAYGTFKEHLGLDDFLKGN